MQQKSTLGPGRTHAVKVLVADLLPSEIETCNRLYLAKRCTQEPIRVCFLRANIRSQDFRKMGTVGRELLPKNVCLKSEPPSRKGTSLATGLWDYGNMTTWILKSINQPRAK